jgi:hypothetical protein
MLNVAALTAAKKNKREKSPELKDAHKSRLALPD